MGRIPQNIKTRINLNKHLECTAPQKLDRKNLTFGVFYYEIEL